MKLFNKINVTMGLTTLIVAAICAIEPTLITCTCFGFCAGTFVTDTIFNWKHR